MSQRPNEEKNQPTPLPPQTTAIVHIEKPEAFFLAWLRTESNHHSFYEYMVTQAQQSHDGLSVKYSLPILETNLLLQSLGFLFLNAEKHYQTVYPTLIGIDDREIRLMTMQDMKQSISAALSTFYEFLVTRMKLDREDYNQGIERLKKEIEQQIENTEIFLQIYHELQFISQLEGMKKSGELQTLKEMLEEIEKIFKLLLSEALKVQKLEIPIIPIKQNLEAQEIIKIIDEAEESEIFPLLANLNDLGLVNSIVALAAIRKISPHQLIELCQFLPQKVIDRKVALAAINKRRETHYIGILSPWTDITNKEISIKILQSASPKTWWQI